MRASMNKKKNVKLSLFFLNYIKYNVVWEQWYDMNVIFFMFIKSLLCKSQGDVSWKRVIEK